MGGNIFEEARPYEAAEYWELAFKVCAKLHDMTRAQVVPAYRNKHVFGDMDVLFRSNLDDTASHNLIARWFPGPISSNGRVTSVLVDRLQVDFIASPAAEYEAALAYFSYNDLGNLMGRVAKTAFGLKYGHSGLLCPVRVNNSHEVGTVVVSRDPSRILPFLGYDWKRFNAGFDTLNDIFDYAETSQYFSPTAYAFDNLNHINRTRNRKRASYAAFVERLGERANGPAPEPLSDEFVAARLRHHFPALELESKRAELIRTDVERSSAQKRVVVLLQSQGYSGQALGVKLTAANLKLAALFGCEVAAAINRSTDQYLLKVIANA